MSDGTNGGVYQSYVRSGTQGRPTGCAKCCPSARTWTVQSSTSVAFLANRLPSHYACCFHQPLSSVAKCEPLLPLRALQPRIYCTCRLLIATTELDTGFSGKQVLHHPFKGIRHDTLPQQVSHGTCHGGVQTFVDFKDSKIMY